MTARLPLQTGDDAIESFCRKWKIEELSLFGSVLRTDFRPDSDIDVLATFAHDAAWSFFDRARMNEERRVTALNSLLMQLIKSSAPTK